MVPLLFGITVVLFAVIQAAPGGPEGALLESGRFIDPEVIESYRERLGVDQPVPVQYEAIVDRIEQMVHAAGAMDVNVLCLQEAWTMPFAFCTREKQPWLEFAEPVDGPPNARIRPPRAIAAGPLAVARGHPRDINYHVDGHQSRQDERRQPLSRALKARLSRRRKYNKKVSGYKGQAQPGGVIIARREGDALAAQRQPRQ